MTLGKMQIRAKSLTHEQFRELPLVLEGQGEWADGPLVLEAQYELAALRLAQGSRVTLRHTGRFRCTICERECKKVFDGSCYPCFQNSAQADRCLLNPVGCHYARGTCREPTWGESFCYQPHYVYLAYTDKLKVGITRQGQVPTRWFDQGATQAVLLSRVGSRHQAGLLEDLLCEKFADKSHWLKMLKAGNSRPEKEFFESARLEALTFLKSRLEGPEGERYHAPSTERTRGAEQIELLEKARAVEIEYPLWTEWPDKLPSLNLEKSPRIEDQVLGIKGQYLILRGGAFNVRRHEGYVVDFEGHDSSVPSYAGQ
ncbi:MAG: hypothetical protein RIR26_2041 [Pseudomonadota bacterium]